MKLEDLSGWESTRDPDDLPEGVYTKGADEYHAMFIGPIENDGTMLFESHSKHDDDATNAYPPIAVLANHLRLAGWTVLPPGVSAPRYECPTFPCPREGCGMPRTILGSGCAMPDCTPLRRKQNDE